MPYTTTGLNSGVDGVAAAATYIAVHTADPAGTAGANQAGTRYQTTWAAASGGSRVGSQVAIAVGAGVTITHWSVNTLSTGGTQAYYAALSASETFGSAGTYNFTPTITAAN